MDLVRRYRACHGIISEYQRARPASYLPARYLRAVAIIGAIISHYSRNVATARSARRVSLREGTPRLGTQLAARAIAGERAMCRRAADENTLPATSGFVLSSAERYPRAFGPPVNQSGLLLRGSGSSGIAIAISAENTHLPASVST